MNSTSPVVERAVTLEPEWVCPEHGDRLELAGDLLRCPKGHTFAIRSGIPRFVVGSTYADHFGEQWKRYRLVQLDSFTGTPITRDRMRRCIGDELWNSMAGKQVLECGCGAGRFTEVLLDLKAKVTSIDLSEAVDANQQNFPLSADHRIAQADILHLPFAPQTFDVVFCLGVIQHTPSPEATIAALYKHVKPGGILIIDHYTYELGWYTKTAPLFRMVFKRLPTDTAMRLTEGLVKTLLPVHKKVSGSRLRSIVFRLSPLLTFYQLYPELNDDLQYQFALLDTHDSLTDWYKHFRTRGQIERLLQKMGLTNIWCVYGGNGVEARAQRPG